MQSVVRILRNDEEDDNSSSESVTSSKTKNSTPAEAKTDSADKPIIKVKSFAVVPEEESKTPAKPLQERPTTPVGSPLPVLKINKNFASGAFLVLRSEASNPDPPLWKIDGKALLQKYVAYTEDGKTLYKNTAEYSGWSPNSKKNYFPVCVIFKMQNKKEHIVELERIKWDEPDDSGKDD